MKVIAIVVTALTLAACEDGKHVRDTSIVFSPTPETAAQFSPQFLPHIRNRQLPVLLATLSHCSI